MVISELVNCAQMAGRLAVSIEDQGRLAAILTFFAVQRRVPPMNSTILVVRPRSATGA